MGKIRLLCAPHLDSISTARRSPLVDILSEGWSPSYSTGLDLIKLISILTPCWEV